MPAFKFGTIKWYSCQKSYGFIIPDEGGEDVMFRNAAVTMQLAPRPGDRVAYKPLSGNPDRRFASLIFEAKGRHAERPASPNETEKVAP